MATRKIRSSWWVDFRWKSTRYRKRSPVNTRAGAAQYELVLRERLLRGTPIDPKPAIAQSKSPAATHFANFAEDWFATYVTTNNKPSEQHQKRSVLRHHLVPVFGSLMLDEISSQQVEVFKADALRKALSAKTINNLLSVLRRCLGSAVDWGYLTTVPPIRPLRVCPPPFRVLSAAEGSKLLSDDTEPNWNLAIRIGLRTGLRRGEIMALEWTDIDFARNRLNVRRAVSDGVVTSTKTYRHRTVPLTRDLRSALEQSALPAGLLCPNETGYVRSDAAFARAIVRIAQRVGINHVGWHSLRHTFATDLAAKGVPLHVVKELLGHSSITMTMRYAHVAPSMLDDAIRVLENSLDTPTYPKSGQPVGNTGHVLHPASAQVQRTAA